MSTGLKKTAPLTKIGFIIILIWLCMGTISDNFVEISRMGQNNGEWIKKENDGSETLNDSIRNAQIYQSSIPPPFQSDLNILPHTAQAGNSMTAPGNLTAIVVDSLEYTDKALSTTITKFRTEWTRIFGSQLPLIIINSTIGWEGLNASEKMLCNGSLLIGAANRHFMPLWPVVAANESARIQWNNASVGNGWTLFGGSMAALIKAVAFYGSTLNRFEPWTEIINQPRYPFQIGATSWGISLDQFEVLMQTLVTRCFTAVQFMVQVDQFGNLSLPGYVDPDQSTRTAAALAQLKAYVDIAAQYHIQIYLNTDELVLTSLQYAWLMANLGYTGPAEDEEFPDHLSGEAPGVWQFLEAKYAAAIDGIGSILSPLNRDGFGGFYFRIDDLSNPYPYKFSLMRPMKYLSRFINLTTAAAALLNATVIQRMWILGNEENTFNNATLAAQLLDPIQATNLILRCKETWNDHWYNHPPNPVIGVSHHPWIIGWYCGAAFPDYKGTRFFDLFFEQAGWLNNPNVIGYDMPGLAYASFERLDINPFESANNYYLLQKLWYGNITGDEALRNWFYGCGLGDAATIAQLTTIFNLAHDAFRQVSFYMAWATTGKFRGDILNGGRSVLFEPGRFNMFYDTMQTSAYSNEYTIQEGFTGRDLARQCFESFPTQIMTANGVENLPVLSENELDPQYAGDPANITEQIMALRGNFRHFRDFTEFFAEYRAWHMSFYEWSRTLSPKAWFAAETYRNNVIITYHEYMTRWNGTSFWYRADFTAFDRFWMPLVGQMNAVRLELCITAALYLVLIVAYGTIYRKRKGMIFGKLLLRTETEDVMKLTPISLIIGTIGFPLLVIGSYWSFFHAISQGYAPDLITLIAQTIASLVIGFRVAVLVVPEISPKRRNPQLQGKNGLRRRIMSWFYAGIGVISQIICIGTLFIMGMLGGTMILTAGITLYLVLGIPCLIGLVWGMIIVVRNFRWRTARSPAWLINGFKDIAVLILFIGVSVLCLYLFTLPIGGPIAAFELAGEAL
jgi:hypothetical protein